MENKFVESESDEENLIIIPLKKDFTTNHLLGGEHLQYLLLKDNQQGDIRRADVILFYPTGANITSLPSNSFQNFFQQETISVDGKIIFITLDDIKEFQMEFEDGDKTDLELWTGRAAVDDEDCLDWYWVTTTYGPNGNIITEVWEYMYTSCNMNTGGGGNGSGSGNGNGSGGSGNGSNNGTNGSTNGTGPQPGTPVSGIQKIFEVKRTTTYEINAIYYFAGIRYPNSAINQFTSMAALTPTSHGNIGTAGSSSNIWHSTWTEISNTHNVAPATAVATVTGTVYFPIQGSTVHDDISNTKNWTAAAVIQ